MCKWLHGVVREAAAQSTRYGPPTCRRATAPHTQLLRKGACLSPQSLDCQSGARAQRLRSTYKSQRRVPPGVSGLRAPSQLRPSLRPRVHPAPTAVGKASAQKRRPIRQRLEGGPRSASAARKSASTPKRQMGVVPLHFEQAALCQMGVSGPFGLLSVTWSRWLGSVGTAPSSGRSRRPSECRAETRCAVGLPSEEMP